MDFGQTEKRAYYGSNDDSPLLRTLDLLVPVNIPPTPVSYAEKDSL